MLRQEIKMIEIKERFTKNKMVNYIPFYFYIPYINHNLILYLKV